MRQIYFIIKRTIKLIVFFAQQQIRKIFVEFHCFPFYELSPLPASASRIMKEACDILENMNIKYRITDGTILGIYRNNAFIPHDNDIDIDILDVQDYRIISDIFKKKMNLSIGRKVLYKGKIQQLALYDKDKVIIDLIFWYTNCDEIVNYQEKGYERRQPAKYFFNLDTIIFHNVKYFMPSNIEEWLIFRYGNDWNIPKTYKGDWKEECGDIIRLK
ncbi:MAG TPA: LicD family protein [Bacteroidales bacterium]|nr:LicD family protein [Bacteroidales bacterium]